MKFITRAELREQPEGSIFQEFGKNGLSSPMVFGGPCDVHDYVEAHLLPNEAYGNQGYPPGVLKKFGLSEHDIFICYPTGFGRNGVYDDTRTYLLWEEADRQAVAAWLLDPQKAVAEMNDDPHAAVKADWDVRATTI